MNENKKSIDERIDYVRMQAKALVEYIDRLPEHVKDQPATNRDLSVIAHWFCIMLGEN